MSLHSVFYSARAASRALALIPELTIRNVIRGIANALLLDIANILDSNRLDCERMDDTNPKYDRLLLTEQRLESIARDLRHVATLPSPLRTVLEDRTTDNGLHLQRVSVPLGVVGIIYEARPNVTFDVAALCLMSGNVCLLKGGSDAHHSNMAIVECIQRVLVEYGLPKTCVQLLPADRTAADELMNAIDFVDVIIPRGGQELISAVRKQSRVPVIETGAGIVHTYIDRTADVAKARAIIHNAKTRRPSVCNALDTVLIHREFLYELSTIVEPLAESHVILYADHEAYHTLENSYPLELLFLATEKDFGTEFLSLKMSIKTVSDITEALDHIATHSSKHSEAIIAEDTTLCEQFLHAVDSACVYANASTAFTDGGQFGMGAEIGISTQKLHARGPMALGELTSYKWIIRGAGQTRS